MRPQAELQIGAILALPEHPQFASACAAQSTSLKFEFSASKRCRRKEIAPAVNDEVTEQERLAQRRKSRRNDRTPTLEQVRRGVGTPIPCAANCPREPA